MARCLVRGAGASAPTMGYCVGVLWKAELSNRDLECVCYEYVI